MLHGSTGSIFGWVPRDFQAHFSGQQFHMPWLQWVVSYANSATINSREGQIGKTNFFQCSLTWLAKEEMTLNLSDPEGFKYHHIWTSIQCDSKTDIPNLQAFMYFREPWVVNLNQK